ncbi:hypothetical protein PsYK624_006420 [Phanerochaete sordida]|uniref:Protein kinase domain-containing protein n=1 Tax=Phanerochaete sordida TaxID=48140 RepID=A0A9P3L708_9APHY|nr:hypothetical protein PsYK624_006420 [Phanerochaete sordida]
MRPPIFNLVPPGDPAAHHDTPELKKAALDIATRTGINLLRHMYGQFPLILTYLDEDTAIENPLPLTQYQRPPPLAKANFPDDVEFIRQINEGGATPIFLVKTEDNLRLLKMFPAFGPVPESYRPSRRPDSGRPVDPMRPFMREKEAYAHLQHGGVCEKGYVPQCYGWVELTQAHVEAIARAVPGLVYGDGQDLDDLLDKAYEGLFPKGILIEYFPDAQVLSTRNVTRELAEKAVPSLYAIHAAYVLHGDVQQHNILLLPDGRVIWIDFDSSMCGSDPRLHRHNLFLELQGGWSIFYRRLVSALVSMSNYD